MNPIHWLRLIKPIKTNIDGHYIYLSSLKEKFFVMTSKPINGIICHKVSETNIKGELKPQYVAAFVHKYDSSIHKLTQPNECNVYFKEHKDDLVSIEKIINSTSTE